MACLKCKSDWLTATGRNCASCPHCCKLARCRERKAGRWIDQIEPRDCIVCCKSFVPASVHERKAQTCSDECAAEHKRQWRKQYIREYRKNGPSSKQIHGDPKPPCKRCGKEVGRRREEYCGRKCYQADKKEGVIEWDRTGQQIGNIRKRRAQGLPMPSQVMYEAIQLAMNRHAKGVADLWKALNDWRPCLHCGGPLPDHAQDFTMFCSIPCSSSYPHDVNCKKCGKRFVKIGMQGRQPFCDQCRRKQINKQRRLYGKNIKERAIRFGVERVRYNRDSVFERDGWRCQLCGCGLLRKWTVNKNTLAPHQRNATIDHIVPMAKGGADAEWNVQACCLLCNTRKGTFTKGQLRLKL